MEYLKKKSGGCSSMNYAGVSDNYMLMDNAIAKTGGARKVDSKPKTTRGGNTEISEKQLFSGGNPLNDMLGGALRRHGGGDDDKNDMSGGAQAVVFFNQCHRHSQLGAANGAYITSRTRTDHNHTKLIHAIHFLQK